MPSYICPFDYIERAANGQQIPLAGETLIIKKTADNSTLATITTGEQGEVDYPAGLGVAAGTAVYFDHSIYASVSQITAASVDEAIKLNKQTVFIAIDNYIKSDGIIFEFYAIDQLNNDVPPLFLGSCPTGGTIRIPFDDTEKNFKVYQIARSANGAQNTTFFDNAPNETAAFAGRGISDLLPDQTDNAGMSLVTDGASLSWSFPIPPTFADADAPQFIIYFSDDRRKLCYRDYTDTINELY